MKKLFVSLVCFLSLVSIFPTKALAWDPLLISSWSITTSYYGNCRTEEAYQTFAADSYTVDGLGLYVYVQPTFIFPSDQAKIKITIYNISSIWLYSEVASYTKAINKQSGWTVFDMDDLFLAPGYYAIGVKSISSSTNVIWAGTEGIYPFGHAIYDDEIVENIDFGFIIYGQWGEVSQGLDLDNIDQGSEPAPADQSTSSSASTPSSSGASGSTSSTSTVSNTSTGTGVNQTSVAEPTSAELSKANQEISSVKPISDDELRELLAFIKAEHEKNRANGIFGLGGVLGDILSFRNVIIFLALIAIISVISILRKKKNTAQATSEPPKE